MLILLGASAGSLFPAAGSALRKEYDHWVRRAWTTDNGLPQDTVYALAQTADGRLWIGSEGGLACFDGAGFTVYRKRATPGLASDSITSLSPAADGSLWIGTFGGGLSRLRDGRFTRIEGLADDRIWALHRDLQGVLWVVTNEGAAYCLDGKGTPSLAVIDGLPDGRITAIAGNEGRVLWIGTQGGLAAIRRGRQAQFRARDGLAGDYVYSLFIDSRGALWAGTTAGLTRIDSRGVRSFTTADGLADNLVRAIAEDTLGRLWIGTDKGVTIMEPRESGLCATPDGLAGGAVMAICRDREGGMWVGTAAGGLSCWRRNEVSVLGMAEGLSGRQITSICEDAEGRLWAGTRGQGLNRMEGETWRSYSSRDGLAGGYVTALAAGGGRLWIGTRESGLQMLAGNRFVSLGRKDGLSSDAILSLFIGREGTLWIGSDGGGLSAVPPGNTLRAGIPPGLGGRVVLAVAEDGEGNLMAGTAREGLYVRRRGAWRRFGTGDGLAGDSVYAIQVDGRNNVWLGTNNGLSLWRQGNFYGFRHGPEPLNRAILAILDDSAGRLWMSSPAGIFSAVRSELEASAATGGAGVHCREFNEMSGMRSTVCPGGFQPAACRDRGGRLWFPTQDGLVQIDPQRLGAPPPPIPRIERVQADGLNVPLAGHRAFAAGTANFDFQFAAASFADPRQVEFSSLLEGFESDWSRPTAARSRRIGALGPGSYVFRVRARGLSGRWNEGGSFSFSVQADFLRTPWFPALLLAGGGSAAAALLAFRRRRARRRREDKYRSSTLSSDRIVAIAARLEQAMEQDRLYLDPELTLARLAAATGIPAKHLSQVINERQGLNFNDFVNRFRVEEAKRKLLDPAARDFKLLRIAFESGFNSKSVFNSAFRRHAGLSPSEFRRLLGGGEGGAAS